MKHNYYFKRILSALILLMASSLSWAYNFKAENADGVTIYYNLINDGTEAEVTSGTYRYSGEVNIPATLAYNGKTLSVTRIGETAFFLSPGLTSVTIPKSVTSIGQSAFSHCPGLTSVIIPESVTSIGEGAFQYCSGLTSIIVDANNQTYDSRDNCNAIIETTTNTLHTGCQNTIIPESVTSIGEGAFWGCCEDSTSINIPNSVTSIGNYAFDDCPGLTTVTIPEGVTSIGDYAFVACISFTSIDIPNSVTSIGEGAFSSCSSLTSVTVGKSNPVYDSRDSCNAIIETASNTLVAGCQNTIIPGNVTSIGDDAFSSCWGLTSITIPESVTSIGNFAFSSCSGLTSIDIPNSVTSIGDWAFYYCSSLTSVYSRIETPFYIRMVFDNIANDATLYVPQGTKDAYESVGGWTIYFSNVVEFDATGIADTPAGSAESYAVYDLNGTKVNVKGGDLNSLSRGIYVVNGKKTIVK